MGKLYKYQPTLGMSKDDRTEANYAAKIMAWLKSIEDLLTTVATVEYTEDGKTCYINPKAANIASNQAYIEVSGSNVAFGTLSGATSPKWITTTLALANDPIFYIASDSDLLSVGCGGFPWIYAIVSGKYYDGTEAAVEICKSSSDFAWWLAAGNPTGKTTVTDKPATGNTNSYCVKPFTFNASGFITNHVMGIDGGQTTPGAGQIFTIGEHEYICMMSNFVLAI